MKKGLLIILFGTIMYKLISSLCLGNTVGAQWEKPELSGVLLNSVLLEYKKFYLTLSHPASSNLIYVDMNQLRTSVSGFIGTVSEWLSSLGSSSLPTVDTLPDSRVRCAKFANAVQSGYHLEIAQAGLNYHPNYPNISKSDIRITRHQFGTKMNLLDTHCLVTVNGFIHDCVGTETEAFILDGATTARMGNDNHVGVYSFLDIGKLTKIKLEPLKIIPMESHSTLMEKIRFSVEVDLTDKSFFLVLGGYIVLPKENTFFQTSPNTFSLDLNKIPFVERLLESFTLLNLSALNLIPPNQSSESLDLVQVRSDEVIRKYMTLSQSFFVVVDTPQLNIERKVIQRAAFPGQFICHEDPVYPIVGGHGKFFEYWKQEELGKWVVNTRDTYYRRFIYSEGDTERTKYATSALDTTRTYDHTQAYMLEISGSTKIL